MTIDIVPLVASQKNQAAEVLAQSFLKDPLYLAVFHDSDERYLALAGLFEAVVGYTLRYGLVHTTASSESAACWLSPGNTQVTFWRMLRTGLRFQRAVARLNKVARSQLLEALAFSDEIHSRLLRDNAKANHWYLWALGVSPKLQGQGIGGRLLQPVMEMSDRSQTTCYLETFNQRNLAFYERLGFELCNEEIIPGLEVPVWSMIRKPNHGG